MTNISSEANVNKAALKVNFGDAGTVLVSGDHYVVDATGKADANNNIKFSFSIKGLDYTLESGAIVIG